MNSVLPLPLMPSNRVEYHSGADQYCFHRDSARGRKSSFINFPGPQMVEPFGILASVAMTDPFHSEAMDRHQAWMHRWNALLRHVSFLQNPLKRLFSVGRKGGRRTLPRSGRPLAGDFATNCFADTFGLSQSLYLDAKEGVRGHELTARWRSGPFRIGVCGTDPGRFPLSGPAAPSSE